MLAVKSLKSAGHSDPGAGADSPGDLYISFASIWMDLMRFLRQDKEPFHTLDGEIPGLMAVLSPSHGLTCCSRAINLFRPDLPEGCISEEKLFLHSVIKISPMAATSTPIKITPEMEEYIRARSTDMRVATTCEGPLIFSIKTSQPKPTDHIITVGERKVHISAVQAPHIKTINISMLPRCALEKKKH